MTGTTRLALAAVAFVAMAPASLRAQAAPAPAAPDSIAFPRQFVNWVFSNRGDSAFAHAAPQLREGMKSAQGVNDMAGNLLGRFGAMEGIDAEVQFDDGPLKVYVASLRFPGAPEPAGFIIGYHPDTGLVERASVTSLSRIKTRYPQAKLP